jgi:formylglycine-generating enzyme
MSAPGPPDPEPAPRARARRADVSQLFEALQRTTTEQAKVVTNSVGIKLVLLPAGRFLMGSPADEPGHRCNEEPVHEVTLTQPYYLGVTPVTQEQYAAVLGRNPAHFHPGNGGSLLHPVETVSWEEAAEFCRRLSALPAEQQVGRRYRLPTEAEWEYACRAGQLTAFAHGGELSPEDANFDSAARGDDRPPVGQTTRVGAYRSNLFGLADVHGNVWEWCADWFRSDYYRQSPPRDPPGPSAGTYRVLRGGSWRHQAATCRAAYRNALAPHHRDRFTGFRVLSPAAPAG